jgi:carbohydrate diacid regulator
MHSFEEARLAAELAAGSVSGLEQQGAAFVFCDNLVVKTQLAKRLLEPVVDQHLLLTTVTEFLAHDLSPSRTAVALGIHRHTLAYRLDRFTQLTGIDPRRFDDATELRASLLVLHHVRSRGMTGS